MTARCLVIGNSHTAALRQAASAFAADWPGLDLDFAAMHGDVTGFAVEGGMLTGRDEDARTRLARISGKAAFRLSDYACLALCGDTPSAFHAVQLWRQARSPALPSTETVALHRGPDWMLLSPACFQAALAGLMQTARGFALLDQLQGTGPRPFLIPTPLLSARAIGQGPRFAAFTDLHAQGDGPALAALAEAALHDACRGRATALPWPGETRQHGFFTHEHFHRDARRLGQDDALAQPPEDMLHANADYGRAVLSALYRQM